MSEWCEIAHNYILECHKIYISTLNNEAPTSKERIPIIILYQCFRNNFNFVIGAYGFMPILIFIQQFKILQGKVPGTKPVHYIIDGSLGVCPGLTEED